jgi:CubicO group peptidase (beta-lactamase class C family)
MTVSDSHLRMISQDAVAARTVSGLTILIGREGRSHLLVFGHRQVEPQTLPNTADTLWDLASLTKPFVTALLCMGALEQAAIDLGLPLGAAPDGEDAITKGKITLSMALSHSAGFPAHRPFYAQALGPGAQGAGTESPRAAVVQAARRVPLEYRPGTRSIYSDVGFILLGDWLERHLGRRLDHAANDVFAPLGLTSLTYRPIVANGSGIASSAAEPPVVAATERCPVRGRVVVGEVHDLNAYAMGGVAGHAGLFGTAADVGTLAHALCAAYRGAPLQAGTRPLVARDVLRRFWSPAGVPGSTWRLGWDGPSPSGSLAGDLIARTAVGHLAFTGCSIWIDPERETFVLVLSNRIHPEVRDDRPFRQLRRALNDAALTAVGYRP